MIKNKVGIIGLGYVGLPLSLAFARAKFDVYGFDIDKKKINILNNKKSYIKHIAKIKIWRTYGTKSNTQWPYVVMKEFERKEYFADSGVMKNFLFLMLYE